MRKLFIAATVPLTDSNLIEASAGTGKTYSIAILVIRLILEKKLSVKEILMVTFTKAAVAELEERIRLFVREAYRASKGEEINDPALKNIVINFGDNAEAQQLLKEAVLFLDETSVLTIHSFCQKTLNEFAFETNQLFGAETIKDTAAIIEDEVNKFWRKNITTLSPELLKPLIFDGHLSKKSLQDAVKQYLEGKRFFSFDEKVNFSLDGDRQSSFLKELKELKEKEDQLNAALFTYIQNNSATLKSACANDSNARKNILPLIDSPADFIKYIRQKRKSNYVAKLFFEILGQCDDCDTAKEEFNKKLSEIINHVICYALQETLRGIKGYKHLNNQISFDDMITKVHEAVMKSESKGRLINELQKKYKAVFVDEFQDTDRLQYEIFQKAFSENTILFYIGDPKQSIYAFRKADIFTYFKAYKEVKNIYQMNENFRSSEKMIEAMNSFFLPKPGFDTFYFGHSDEAITYTKVASPTCNKKGRMMKGKHEIAPIKITPLRNKVSIINSVATEVIDLLTNPEYSIPGKDGIRKIIPSDIGILVRTGKESKKIKEQLSRLGVPSVTVSDEKILRSGEAKYLLYLLQAIADPSGAKVNKGLLSPFTGFTAEDILQLNDERVIRLFKKYKARWEEHSIYTALTDFIADFNVQSVLLKNNVENGERTITNLVHLAELLHKIQSNKNLSPFELISWLKRGIEGMELEGDEYLQRIENDEDAVKITTIHSSKGLEYNIVIAPFLDMVNVHKTNEDPIQSFRIPATGEYVTMKWSSMNEDQKQLYDQQEEQGNRRLVYVAITRAVYQCSLYKNTNNKAPYDYSNSSIAPFINAVETSNPLIQFQEPTKISDDTQYRQDAAWQAPREIQNVSFKLTQEGWAKMSYTFLAAKHEPVFRNFSSRQNNDYDDFVFRQLKKGVVTGNMLHEIFENIHFGDTANAHYFIDRAIVLFAPQQKELYQQMLPQMIDGILKTKIKIDKRILQLCNVADEKRIHEFEFDFPVDPFTVEKIEELSDEFIRINVRSDGELEGIMNGRLDLFFEHEGKYYILDWKSNYLGDTLEDYSAAALSIAMNENNYHLQYLIYTLALKKYLENRLQNFDYGRDFGGVIYVFLRGVRAGTDFGIFTTKPSPEKISALEEMMQRRVGVI